MDFDAMTFRSANSRARHVLLWAGCAAIFAAGVWCTASAASAFTNAHVRVQPQVGAHTNVIGLPSGGRHTATGLSTPYSASMAAGPAQPTSTLRAAALGAAIGPWLSMAAILISIAAAVLNIWKRAQPETVLPAPVYLAAPPAVAPQRSSNQMDEVALAIKEQQARSKNLTPKQVILELQRGNARFWSGSPERPEMNAMERRALIMAQAPSVCLLSCADSRVPVEIVFDQGLGSVFVVRVAGNILDSTAMGSIEFSVKALGVKVILVMGHEGCGAVKGAMSMSVADLDAQPAYLQSVLRSIKGNLNLDKLSKIRDSRAQDREAIVTNVSSQVKKLQENKLVAEKVASGSLLVCGAFYEITSGIVDFFSLDKNGLVIDV